jgi:hypothetical protein
LQYARQMGQMQAQQVHGQQQHQQQRRLNCEVYGTNSMCSAESATANESTAVASRHGPLLPVHLPIPGPAGSRTSKRKRSSKYDGDLMYYSGCITSEMT